MSVETIKSTNLTNLGSVEQLYNPNQRNRQTTIIDSISVGTANLDDDGDIWLLAIVPSNATIVSLVFFNDALDSGSALTCDVGVANGPDKFIDGSTTYAAYATISDELFADDNTSFRAAVTTGTELVIANATSHVDEMNQPLWQRAGLAADPLKQFCIAVHVDTVANTAVAGKVVCVVKYITA